MYHLACNHSHTGHSACHKPRWWDSLRRWGARPIRVISRADIGSHSAEHVTTVEDAYKSHMTAALCHVLGGTIQTAMFNTPLVVLVGLANQRPLDLEVKLFNMVSLVLSILVVGSFTKDLKSNYLEGSLCLLVYLLIAVGSYFDWWKPELSVDETSTERGRRNWGGALG